ncbi:hypothetical protein JRZ83_05025 [Dickeya dianthicola]|nr:hypothetical protein [Dickeya dianthicola]QVH40282.1 hypothetical protein JRZ93_05020 [Dickeya dianthicola]QVH44482.1 hypothetical protein JRZ83_05025 [Dickeya dianthicola]QVH48681.1 hypothetical protein JRZ88_05025 [Dickeya dianthicola]QVH52882.1 hypothetical protein JRZ86_05030 [Dickeya dianthicola]QVH57080.1 hypothetical protein JRZ87_05015 [Dickeya dianthicola]
MGASPINGTVYYGTLNTEKSMWVGNKIDVTDMAYRAVAESLMHKKQDIIFQLNDGRELVLSADVRDCTVDSPIQQNGQKEDDSNSALCVGG